MTVALRAVHDRLRGAGEPAALWARLTDELVRQPGVEHPLEGQDVDRALIACGLRGTAGEWLHYFSSLGVIGGDRRLVPHRIELVRGALELVGESFNSTGIAKSWAPVATLPPELRLLWRPPVLRQTAGVLMELIDGAADEVILASPFADTDAVRVLSVSLGAARVRGVDVRVLTSVGHSQHFAGLDVVNGDRAGRIVVTEIRTEISPLGSHAKVLVADRLRAYVGSANMTAAGLGRNIEIGVEATGTQVDDLARLLLALEGLGRRVWETSDSRPGFP